MNIREDRPTTEMQVVYRLHQHHRTLVTSLLSYEILARLYKRKWMIEKEYMQYSTHKTQ